MKPKWKLAALLLVSAAAVAAAALYIKSADSGDRSGQAAGTPPAASVHASPAPDGIPSAQSQGAPASDAPEKLVNPEQMKQDLDFLTETLVQVHPALINGWSSGQQQVISEAYDMIQTARTEEGFYFIVNTITSLLQDGHTNMYWELQNQKLLNLPLFWSREGLIVTQDRGKLHTGDIVTAISRRSIGDLEQELAKIIPAENNQWVRVQGTVLLRVEFMLRHLGLAADDRVEITVTRGGGSITETLILTDKPLQKEYSHYPKGEVPFSYSFEDELSLGIFQLNTCENTRKYLVTVKQFFDEVKARGIQHVAVDLRSNGGGDSSVIEEFLSYTNVKSYYGYGSLMRYSQQLQNIRGAEQNSGYVVSEPSLNHILMKTLYPFRGKLYLLTSAHTFSSANMFAVIVQDNGLGQIIGEATGNQPSSYGDVLTFQLPASGIRFQSSFKQFTRPAPERDPADSVQPDIEAYTTATDILERRDAQLEKLREVVRADLK
ncbi:S41 family peptidase [Paenibacillus camerounensis]|uniref:S41 family peptidase n=1 Tax=Paenibacillus camerounensis TaxID=1243663 RepID=UPI0005AAAC8C|nr:S41 family peptidase [Paenibacillus camerounensis]